MALALLRLSRRAAAWWDSLSDRARSAICAALMLGLFALGGAVEASAPGGMYY